MKAAFLHLMAYFAISLGSLEQLNDRDDVPVAHEAAEDWRSPLENKYSLKLSLFTNTSQDLFIPAGSVALNASLSTITYDSASLTIPTAFMSPSFDASSTRNVTAQLGTHAYLYCRVNYLGNKTVSWIRNRDSHILTVNQQTFISDDRFQTRGDPTSGFWTLQIKFVQTRDAGIYECQVSTEPKMSFFVHLSVIEPVVRIPGASEVHVNVGSRVSLSCVISSTLSYPDYVIWYQDMERIELLKIDQKGGVYKENRALYIDRVAEDTTIATLYVMDLSPKDAGVYSCSPAGLPSASVTIHVLNGEHPAAMQRGSSFLIRPLPSLLLIVFLLSLLTQWWKFLALL